MWPGTVQWLREPAEACVCRLAEQCKPEGGEKLFRAPLGRVAACWPLLEMDLGTEVTGLCPST